jgi:hypothetical protein
MPKGNFEFYEVPGVEGEFVIPAPASNPYDGRFSFEAVEQESVDQVAAAVEEGTKVQPDIDVEVVDRDGLGGGYFFDQINEATVVAGRRINLRVDLEDPGDSYFSRQLNAAAASLFQLDSAELPSGLTVVREPTVEGAGYLYDQEDRHPINPKLILRQLIPVRAYQWLPGPVRQSEKRGELPPTYSPRPVDLAVAQLVKIVGINPQAEQPRAS